MSRPMALRVQVLHPARASNKERCSSRGFHMRTRIVRALPASYASMDSEQNENARVCPKCNHEHEKGEACAQCGCDA
jgi:ribosomal protein L37E